MPKNNKPRSVPMTGRVKDIFKRRVVSHKPKPFPYTNDWLGDLWDRAKFKMGLKDDPQFVPYALRHTCASRLVQRGINLRVVQEWMGHKTITVTMRYAHLTPTNLLEAVKVLNPTKES
jgi:integrase